MEKSIRIIEICLVEEKQFTQTEIINSICTFFDVTEKGLFNSCRMRSLVVARHCLYRALKMLCNKSYPEIAIICNRKDHTTILHGAKNMDIEKQKIYKQFLIKLHDDRNNNTAGKTNIGTEF
jgi:chromosomal replication initiation ATPase DnaA